ncbi:FlgD immunoglobulin-like domain containing protein [Nocardioides oleivorans]|uniref:FlgD immunoglobulin-like domain containing protein n=1 Tax=Nocardioides oleivorans TaxID=273676 RepID=UPI0013ECAD55|nr:FlgD immunoglobulin-like domain containing protein [Nocardioides oleivorans]
MNTTRSTTAVPALAFLVLVLSVLGLQPPATAAPDPLVGYVGGTRYFSPDGDGVQDRVQVGFDLDQPAVVTLVVVRSRSGRAVRHVELGRLRAEVHTWWWNGRDDRGRRVGDGDFRVRVVATARGHRQVRSTGVGLRTTYVEPTGHSVRPTSFDVTRDTLHPTTTAFTDTVLVRASYWSTRFRFGGSSSSLVRAALELRNAAGRVVNRFGDRTAPESDPRELTGLRSDGTRLPAGGYTLVATIRDYYGNPRRLRLPMAVSDVPLVEQRTWTTSVGAAAALTEPDITTMCPYDCVVNCPPQASPRLPGGLTVLSPASSRARIDTDCTDSRGEFAVTAPFALDPMDRVSLTSTGAEVPVGGTGQGTLYLFTGTPPSASTTPGAALTILGPAPWSQRSGGGSSTRIGWQFSGGLLGDTDYDLASFDVTVVHYAPAA